MTTMINPAEVGFEDPRGQDVAPRAGTELEVVDFGEDAGRGLEDITSAELQTPFLSILQGLSPQVDPSEAKYIPEARMGMILNTVTGDLYDGQIGMEIIPVYRRPTFTEWTPREQGGGFLGEREIDDPEVQRLQREQGRFKKLQTPTGSDLIEQYNVFCYYGASAITEDNANMAVLAFTSTKIGPYRRFITQASGITYPDPRGGKPIKPPLYAHRWRMTTVSQENPKGKFFNYKLALAAGTPHASLVKRTAPLYDMCRSFYDMLISGQAAANYAAAGDSVTEDAETIPF